MSFYRDHGHLRSKSAHSQFFLSKIENCKVVVLCITDLPCKYLLGGWVTLEEWAFWQILTLRDYSPCFTKAVHSLAKLRTWELLILFVCPFVSLFVRVMSDWHLMLTLLGESTFLSKCIVVHSFLKQAVRLDWTLGNFPSI